MIFVGCTFKPIENWQAILPAPQAPSNYKDPVKIQAYIQEKLADLLGGKAATEPLCGAIREATFLFPGASSGNLLSGTSLGHVEVKGGVEFVAKLCELSGSHTVVGYKIHKACQLAAIEYMATKGPLPKDAWWMLDADQQRAYGRLGGYIDPVSLIFGSSDVDLGGVGRRLNIVFDLVNPKELAIAAHTMARLLGLDFTR
jgi:hypothetical protein